MTSPASPTPRRSLRAIIDSQGYALTSYISMPGAFSAELYARAGWDAVTLDLQHGLLGYDSAVAVLQAVAAVGVVPLVRLPWLDPSDIGKILDAGVLGVICPMINSAAEAELLVRYCKYPPRGDRSLGPIRAAMLDGDAYPAGANQAVAVFAMVETAVSLANLDEILAVDGVDGIYIGPGDLAVSMGVEPRMEGYHPDVDRAIDRIAQACATHGKIAGILAPNPDAGRRMLQRGFRFLTLSSDARALAAQARGWVTDVRRHAEGLQL